MVNRLTKLFILLAVLYATSKWIILPIATVRITDGGLITAIFCSVILLLTVVLPFVMHKD